MPNSIAEIAAALGAEAAGDLSLTVSGAAEPAQATPDRLAIAVDPKYAPGLALGSAVAALLWPGADWQALGLKAAVFAPRARLALAGVGRLFDPGPGIAPGIHPSAAIDPSAEIGAGAAIAPFVVIGADVRLGAGARIGPHASIGEGAVIGAEALIHAGVRIGARVTVGDRFIAQPGAVVGGDGFSFVTPERSGVEDVRATLGHREEIRAQSWLRIASLGGVTIGDDVEVGANACIDRGTIRDTHIGSGTKLDNLVQVGHNAVIGRDCLLCGLVGIAGSTRLGDRVVLGGQAGVGDNLTVGDDVIAGAGTLILTNVPAGRTLLGYPAVRMDEAVAMHKTLRRLARPAKKAVPKPGESD